MNQAMTQIEDMIEQGPYAEGSRWIAVEFDLARGQRTGRRYTFLAPDIREASAYLVYTLNLSSHGWKVSPSGKTVGRMGGDIGWHLVRASTFAARCMGES